MTRAHGLYTLVTGVGYCRSIQSQKSSCCVAPVFIRRRCFARACSHLRDLDLDWDFDLNFEDLTTAGLASKNTHNTAVNVYQSGSSGHRHYDHAPAMASAAAPGSRHGSQPLRQWFYTVTCRNDVMASSRHCPGCCLAIDHGRCARSCSHDIYSMPVDGA